MTVELLRFKGLMVKERTLREDVLGSRFFHDVSMENAMKTQSIMSPKEESDLKLVFSKIVSGRLEEPITGANNINQFVISRSPNYDGLLDVNFKVIFNHSNHSITGSLFQSHKRTYFQSRIVMDRIWGSGLQGSSLLAIFEGERKGSGPWSEARTFKKC
jgi:hypothetical protein